MTGVEAALLMSLIGVLGVGGGRIWGAKAVENKYLPRQEHELYCKNVQLETKAAIRAMKDEIIQAIKEHGNCSCRTDASHTTQ